MKITGVVAAATFGALAFAGAGSRAEAAGVQEVYHDNVVIILDASGSMRERMRRAPVSKMDAAKEALKEVVKLVPESTHVGLLVFSAANLRDDWAYPLGPRDDRKLTRAIDLPQPGGKTPLGAYIKKGADRLLNERARQLGYGTYRLLVVTDGEAQDRHLVDRYTPEVIARGITMDVIGVDMRQAHTLAARAHSYRKADDPASLKKAVAEVFAEVGGAGTDAAGEEAFELLAPIPEKMAVSIVDVLSTSGNQPIGRRPAATGRRVASTPGQGPTAAQTQAPAKGHGTGAVGTIVIILVVIAAFVVSSIIRQRKRS